LNGAARELRRPWCYLVALLVAGGAKAAGLPWFLGVTIGVFALAMGIGVGAWVGRRVEGAPDAPLGPTQSDGAALQHSPEADDSIFRLEGEFWTIRYHSATFRLHDAKGLRYLHQLLANPGQEMHALDLEFFGTRTTAVPPSALWELTRQSTAEPILDLQAREEYQRAMEVLEEQIDKALSDGDAERAALAIDKREFIKHELDRQTRKDGTSRLMPDATERARLNVSRAIRASIAKIDSQDAALGHHLNHDVRTGTFCAYLPDPTAPPRWRL